MRFYKFIGCPWIRLKPYKKYELQYGLEAEVNQGQVPVKEKAKKISEVLNPRNYTISFTEEIHLPKYVPPTSVIAKPFSTVDPLQQSQASILSTPRF
jgi:hypothetical protein